MNRYFADVSNNNPQPVGWGSYGKLGQHVLVGLKATEGLSFIDKTHETRSENAHKAGVWVMHYHFAHPNESPEAQARFFWTMIKNHFAPRDFACIDIEVGLGAEGDPNRKTLAAHPDAIAMSSNAISQFVVAFNREFKRISGHSLIGYSSESFHAGIGNCGIRRWWLAAYGPNKPAGAWAWQFTDGREGPTPHSCVGIGKCDISSLNWATYLRLRLSKPRV